MTTGEWIMTLCVAMVATAQGVMLNFSGRDRQNTRLWAERARQDAQASQVLRCEAQALLEEARSLVTCQGCGETLSKGGHGPNQGYGGCV